MTKLIVSEFVSVNGIMEAPGGEKAHPHTGWTFEAIYGEDHYDFLVRGARGGGLGPARARG
jgi:hypothetical protein